MHWTQILYLGLLIFGTGAAIAKDRWVLASVLWLNFTGTMALAGDPFAVGVLDIVCASILVTFGARRDYVVASLFVVMILVYRLEEQLSRAMMYTVVDLLAYGQIVIAGGGGFGELYRGTKSFIRDLRRASHSAPVRSGGDSEGNRKDAMGRDQINGAQK